MLPYCASNTIRRVALIFVFFSVLVLYQTKTPPTIEAQGQSENNTAVFSGQFIPAFVGSAYDPTAAYQRMAGLPVYVFSYDSWAGSAFIINNLAVRTQIRADGSFQAQGLPNGQKFGVYFPYRAIASGGTVTGMARTDCPNTTDPLCANGIQPNEVAFRMPLPADGDKIIDVFSYNMADATALQGISDQLGAEVRLGLTFLTQETRVDIENNINTFPLVPTTTLKITTKPYTMYDADYITDLFEESAYEVVARRIWFDQGLGVQFRYRTGDNLTIRGRTTFPISAEYLRNAERPKNDRSFMTYAPPGIYAVTVWRNDGGTDYQNYDSVAPDVNSIFSGLGIMPVSQDSGGGLFSLDWANQLPGTKRNDIPILPNAFIVWGRVFEPLGRSWEGNASIGLIGSQPDLSFFAKQRNSDSPSCSLFTPFTIGGSRIESHPGNADCGTDPTTAGFTDPANPVTDVTEIGFQTYAFFENVSLNLGSSRAVVLEPFVNMATKDMTPVQIPLFLSSKGPVQQDLTVNNPPTNGIIIKVTSSNLSLANVAPSKHAFYVQVSKAEPTETRTIPAIKQQFYLSDASGNIFIPHGELLPLNGDVASPFRLILTVFGTDDSVPQELPIQDYDYSATDAIRLSVALTAYAPSPPEGYKFLGLLPARLLMPGAQESLAASATEADFSIQFSNAKAYQSVVLYNNLGNEVWHIRDDYLESKSGTWVHQTQLEYKKPDTACAGIGQTRELCQSAVDKSNTYTLVVTADGSTLSESVVVRHSPEQSIAVAYPNTWQADFTTECQKLKTAMIEEIDKETEAAKAGLGPLDTERISINMQGSFNKLTDATIPYIGCNISLRFSNIVSKGLQSFHELLLLEPLTISVAVTTTWNLVRGMANVFFVFILIIVGINHALGYDIKNWGANVMLPEIIKGVIFANLSLLIVQGILDVNNIATSWIFALVYDVLETTGISANAIAGTGAVGGVFAVSSFFGAAISGGITTAIASIAGSGGTLIIPLIGVLISGALMLLGFVITLFGIFFGRYLIIWIITITAPMFFLLSVLPWFRSMRNLWIKTVIPLATMQTVTALFIAIGILMLSKSAEADALLVQAGIFLIGGGSLFMSIKSPSLTAQFLGGGGLAGQAFGALQGLTKGVGGFVGQKAAGISEYTSLGAIEERREASATRDAKRSARIARLGPESRGDRLLNRLTDNRMAESRDAREQKLSKRIEARQKAAEAVAVGPKFDILNDEKYQDTEGERGLVDRFRGQATAGSNQAYRDNIEPSVHVLAKTGFKPKQFEAFKTNIDLDVAHPDERTNWGGTVQRDSSGKVVKGADGKPQVLPGGDTVTNFQGFMRHLHENSEVWKGLSVDQKEIDKIRSVSSQKDFEKLHKDVQARIMEEVKVRAGQNAPGQKAVAASEGQAAQPRIKTIGDNFADGRRVARQYDELKVETAAGDKK